MTSSRGRAIIWLVAVGIVALAGCGSFSDSSKSSSKFISSPITSSSGSSSPEDAYREDVRDYTAAHIKSGGTTADLRTEIGRLAEKHGISDWESSEATYTGVGEGLAKAGYKQVEVDAFKKNMAETPDQAEWIQKGYDSAR
jgi:hypothetical protein